MIKKHLTHGQKIFIGVMLFIISLILGAYSKVMLFVHITNPTMWWLNLALYLVSWLILFVAAYIVGKEIMQMIDEYLKNKVKETYDVTIEIHKKGAKHVHKHVKKNVKTGVRHVKKNVHKGVHHVKKGVKKILERIFLSLKKSFF